MFHNIQYIYYFISDIRFSTITLVILTVILNISHTNMIFPLVCVYSNKRWIFFS